MKKINKKNKVIKASVSCALVVAVAVIIVLSMAGPYPSLRFDPDNERWSIVWDGNLAEAIGNEADPAAGPFLEIFFVNHSAGNDYASQNDSAIIQTWCNSTWGGKTGYASADNFDLTISSGVLFDIVVRVGYDKTTGPWNGANWVATNARVNITCSGDLSISDETGTLTATYNATGCDYLYCNIYWDNSGSGYSINDDETFDVDEISIEAKY